MNEEEENSGAGMSQLVDSITADMAAIKRVEEIVERIKSGKQRVTGDFHEPLVGARHVATMTHSYIKILGEFYEALSGVYLQKYTAHLANRGAKQ